VGQVEGEAAEGLAPVLLHVPLLFARAVCPSEVVVEDVCASGGLEKILASQRPGLLPKQSHCRESTLYSKTLPSAPGRRRMQELGGPAARESAEHPHRRPGRTCHRTSAGRRSALDRILKSQCPGIDVYDVKPLKSELLRIFADEHQHGSHRAENDGCNMAQHGCARNAAVRAGSAFLRPRGRDKDCKFKIPQSVSSCKFLHDVLW
jgi:hypothetical protein